MIRRMISLAILIAGVSFASAQESSRGRRVSSQVSPKGTFELVSYQRREVLRTVTELRLEAQKSGFKDQVLFRGNESTWAFISPGEEWIAVNSVASDRTGFLYLFRLNDRQLYEEVEVEVDRRAVAALMKATERTEPPRFDTFYCYADFWSPTSGALFAHIEGRERGAERSFRFYFVYDPVKEQVSLDLNVLNKGAFSR